MVAYLVGTTHRTPAHHATPHHAAPQQCTVDVLVPLIRLHLLKLLDSPCCCLSRPCHQRRYAKLKNAPWTLVSENLTDNTYKITYRFADAKTLEAFQKW